MGDLRTDEYDYRVDHTWGDIPWEDPSHLGDPNLGNPDADAGQDSPDQRPITDNKAGG